jgi:hypothetical protein
LLQYQDPTEEELTEKIDSQGRDLENGLGKLVLMVVELLRQVLERQAVRRMENGDLTSEEVERLGNAFLRLKNRMEELSEHFGVEENDLEVTLGKLIRSQVTGLDNVSLVDVLDRLISKGVVLAGKVSISVADVDLIGLDLYAALHPIVGASRKRRN